MASGYSVKTYSNKGFLDADAQLFLTAAAITDSMQRTAISYLVDNLKSGSLWTKILCLYPFVGGTASTHSYNLKAPGSFQITWVNSPVHDAYGVQFNGTNTYGNTGFIPSVQMTLNNTALHTYSRTIGGATSSGNEIGAFTSSTSRFETTLRISGDFFQSRHYSTTDILSTTNTTTHGLFTTNRTSSTLLENYIRGVLQSPTSAIVNVSTLPTVQFLLGTGTTALRFSNKQHALDAFTTGMTAAEITLFSNIIKQYQLILGRSV